MLVATGSTGGSRHGIVGGLRAMRGGAGSSTTMTTTTTLTFVRRSHIGSAPLYVPHTTTLKVLPFAPVANPLRRQPATMIKARGISVEGPLGTVVVPLYENVSLQWTDVAATAADADATSTEQEPRKLTLSIKDAKDKKQRGIWGLTRALLANAIEGVQDGHTTVVRLVGVGYRAAIEADPFPRPDAFEQAFAAIEASSYQAAPVSTSVQSSKTFGNFTNPAQRDFYAAIVNRGKELEQPKQRLSIRLGYSHPIFMPIPRGLTCLTPQPTRIILKSADKELLGAFASSIRKWRPPEPYKGKGVFVGDETIKLKAVRKK